MARTARVISEHQRYGQTICVGPHLLHADEPNDVGGHDAGPNPYELLLAALGACTSITVRMYADRKQWPLREVRVDLSYSRVHVEDPAESASENGVIERIAIRISFTGDLSENQRSRLLEVANKCPVHRTLVSKVVVETSLRDADDRDVAVSTLG
jgi:putative redox protein